MKKRILTMVLAVLFLLPLISLTARADIIYEPRDDFYNLHRDECDYVARNYIADDPNGDVTVYVSPETDKEVKKIPNGTEIYISYTYEDDRGILWGYCDFWEENKAGWLPMEYMELIYDFISFREEYGSEFLEEEGTVDSAWSGKEIVFCSYPGSDRYNAVEVGESMPAYQYVYVDDNGTRWGYGGYYMGMRNFWINLDDPTKIPEKKEETPEAESPATQPEAQEEIKPQRSSMLTVCLIGAVAAVVGVTGASLKKMKKKA